jgi:mono/diheme cytochrome c family protein
MSKVGGLFAVVLLLAACVTETAPTWRSGDAVVGHQVARDNCASCHAVERTGDSPKLGALPFRNILAGYRPDWLADDLHTSQAIAPGRMPVFHFGEGHEYDILAWMISIQDAPIHEPGE